ncbi:hypothetical protein ABE096_05395 [Robertmurraya massiliosenegalensis]|uniref:hypothetical protein n=1 Tax=Robertmurraya TaxID=2837507 RepID=UPI0039A72328
MVQVKNDVEIKGLVHLEILHDNPSEAAEFLQEVLGAERCEEGFSSLIEREFDCENIHMKAGNVIFQVIKPNPEFRPELNTWWQRDLLDKQGPFLHNITLLVKNADRFAQKIVEHGGTKMGAKDALAPDMQHINTVHMYDASKQCGMRFEFVEAPPEME